MRVVFWVFWGWMTSASVAYAQPMFQVVMGLDYGSLFTSMVMAFVFSIIRTGLTLLSRQPVKQVWREVISDQIAGFVAGGAAHLLIEAALAQGLFDLKPVTRIVLVGTAGALRFAFFGMVADAIKRAVDKAIDRIAGAKGGKN